MGMGVLREGGGWCFCSGGGRSERIKGCIFSTKGPALAAITAGGGSVGTGFLIHRNLLLTSHANLPSAAASEVAEIRLHHGRIPARLVPHRFFITSSVLDLTIVGLDTVDAESTSTGHQLYHLKTCCTPIIDLGSVVYVLGHTDKEELIVGEGKVVVSTDTLIKLSTDGVTWCPGSGGFDAQGNLAFMVCDPMKLASSPVGNKSSSSSSSVTWKKDFSMQFGIPIPVICDWLHQHWEGSLDELSKPKLPLIRLMSTGQKTEHSCSSLSMRQVFKPVEGEDVDISSSSQVVSRPRHQLGSVSSANTTISEEEIWPADLREQGIPTPQIYESPKLTSGPVRKKDHKTIQLLDINFPPKLPRSNALPLPLRQLLPTPCGNNARETKFGNTSREANHEAFPVGSCQGDCCSEVQSSSSPLEVSEFRNEGDGFSSGEETMYSAETMESRNFPSPRENKFEQVGRSQSCVNYSRCSSSERISAVHKGNLQKQKILVSARKTRSQASVMPQKSREYFSPTVSSSMKKRNDSDPSRPRQNVIQPSPRWSVLRRINRSLEDPDFMRGRGKNRTY